MQSLNCPGESQQLIAGPAGAIETWWSCPQNNYSDSSDNDVNNADWVAVICHPLPTGGGTMHNKVVTMTAKAMHDLGIPSLRFNFRSVGNSEGEFDNGVGETEDLLAVVNWLRDNYPAKRLILAGFSFGSFVAYNAQSTIHPDLLITIAPPVHHYQYNSVPEPACPLIVIQGDADELVPADLVTDWVASLDISPVYIEMPATSHFFHGKLVEFRKLLVDAITNQLQN